MSTSFPRVVMLAVLAWVAAVPCRARGLDFDQGFDLKAVAGQVREEARTAPAPEFAAAAATKETRDCTTVVFSFESLPVSAPAALQSHVFRKVCELYHGKKICRDQLVRVVRRNVVVALTGQRAMLPWERDVFSVCLQGESVSADNIMASHRYAVRHKPGPGPEEHRIEAEALGKLPTEPDPSGISAESFGYDAAAGGLKLALRDKWAGYYKGERTVLKVVLKKVVPHWFDPIILEKELELSPQDAYELRFADYASAFKQSMERGRDYFVEWGYQRLGKTSRATYQKGGITPRAFHP